MPELRALVRFSLEEDGTLQVVGEAGTARECIEGVAALRPDVVLLDLSMPGMDGLEAIPQIREASPGTAIVVFSGFAADRMSEPAIALGATGYLEKGEPLERVRALVHEVAGRAG